MLERLKKGRTAIEARLAYAGGDLVFGMCRITTCRDFLVFQVACTLVSLTFALILATYLEWPVVFLIALVGAGFPCLRLRAAGKNRRKIILSELPGVIEIIAMGMEAGLSFDASVSYLRSCSRGVIVGCFQKAGIEIESGEAREIAYSRIGETGSSELSLFVNTILESERYGNAIVEEILDLAKRFRERQKIELDKETNRLPTLMLIPIFLFIVPPMLTLYLLPALEQLKQL